MPRIAVVTLYDDNYREIGNIGSRNKFDYCERHGYSFHVLRHLLAAPPASYSKVPLLRGVLGLHDWVMWIDSDALFINFRRRIEEYLDDAYSLIIGEDWNGVQSGVYFLKRSTWSFEFLNRVSSIPRESLRRFTDQEQMSRTIAADADAGRQVSIRRLKQIGGDQDFNCFCRDDATFPDDEEFRYFTERDFVIHFAGMAPRGDHTLLLDLMKKYAQKVIT